MRVTLTFWGLFSFVIFSSMSECYGQAPISTPEEVSGVSVKEMNGLKYMDRDYTRKGDGQPLPQSEDDLWIPDMSLASSPSTLVNSNSSANVKNNSYPQSTAIPVGGNSVPVQSPANHSVSVNSASMSNISGANSPNIFDKTNISGQANIPGPSNNIGANSVKTGSVVPAFNPGFQVGAERKDSLPATSSAVTTNTVAMNSSNLKASSSVPPLTFPSAGPVAVSAGGSSSNQIMTAPRAPIVSHLPMLSGVPAPSGVVQPVQNSAVSQQDNGHQNLGKSNSSSQDNWDDAGFASSKGGVVIPSTSVDNSRLIGTQNKISGMTENSITSTSGAHGIPAKVNGTPISEVPVTGKLPENETAPDSLLGKKLKGTSSLENRDLSECVISDIRVSGLEMPTSKFNNLIKTRINSKYNQQVLEEDKRTLLQTRQFVDVAVSTTVVPEDESKVIVNFDLTQRRLMQYIKVIGNKAFSKSHILEELGMKRGETRLDPYDVENGRLRIIELYKTKGYAEPHVAIMCGDRPEDIGVVYIIDEGCKQRVLKTEFIGNTVVSSGRLKHLISSKPGLMYVIGGDFSREILDDDVKKLLEYYRNLGYFDACIDREYEEGEGYTGLGKENAWVSVLFTINEGPRYKVRNIYFAGNKVLSEDALKEITKTVSGNFYNKAEIEGDRIKIKNKYHNLGYVLADIVPAQVFTEEEGMLDLRFDIAEKKRYRARDIIVDFEGEECRTKSTVIMNMLDIYPGMLLDGEKIKSSEVSLRRSGYFNDKPQEGVVPTIKIIPDTDMPIPVKKAEGPKEDQKKDSEKGVIRGQTRQIPVGFGNTTTSGPIANGYGSVTAGNNTASTGNYNQNNYNQGNYNQNNYNQNNYNQGGYAKGNSNSPYADTSGIYTGSANASPYNNLGQAYNQGQTMNPAYNQTPVYGQNQSSMATSTVPGYGTNPNSVSPIVSGTGATSVTGVDNPLVTGSEAPGFIAASNLSPQGPVFPRTPQSESVNGLSLDPSDNIGNADVVAQVREGRTGMIQASVGVNSDYGLVGNVSLTERNFDLFRLPTSLWRADGWTDAFRGGGQIFQVQACPGTDIQRYSVSWDVPYVFNSKYSFGSSATYGDRNYTDWFETRYGGELRLGRQWNPRFSTSTYGSIYNVRITDPLVNYVPDLTEALGRHNLYTAGLSASYDTRNHPFLPSEGGVVSGSVEEVMGDYQYPRVELSARKYYTLRKRWDGTGRWILGLKSSAGWIDTPAPIFERFYGGGTTFRGFEYREVTPRYANTGFGIGGNFEFYASAEMLVPVSGGDEFMLAFFVDTGTVSRNIRDWETYRVAPGVGFRISIPMLGPAPLALDFAFPINKAKDDVDQVFSFSVTGSR